MLLKYALITYGALSLVVAGRNVVHLRRFDDLDWAYERFEIIAHLVLFQVLWPLLLMSPEVRRDWFKDAGTAFSLSGLAARIRVDRDFFANPPPCSAVVSYTQDDWPRDKALPPVVFAFEAIDVLKQLAPGHYLQEELMERWLNQRDPSIRTPTPVPPQLHMFSYVAAGLLESGVGSVHCPKCNQTFTARDLSHTMSDVRCPGGHALIQFFTCILRG